MNVNLSCARKLRLALGWAPLLLALPSPAHACHLCHRTWPAVSGIVEWGGLFVLWMCLGLLPLRGPSRLWSLGPGLVALWIGWPGETHLWALAWGLLLAGVAWVAVVRGWRAGERGVMATRASLALVATAMVVGMAMVPTVRTNSSVCRARLAAYGDALQGYAATHRGHFPRDERGVMTLVRDIPPRCYELDRGVGPEQVRYIQKVWGLQFTDYCYEVSSDATAFTLTCESGSHLGFSLLYTSRNGLFTRDIGHSGCTRL